MLLNCASTEANGLDDRRRQTAIRRAPSEIDAPPMQCLHLCSVDRTQRRRPRLAALCTALALASADVWAQETPQLSPKPLTKSEPQTPQEVPFYKGKGPGGGNSYGSRYEEDYAYLRDARLSTDLFDPLKYVAIFPNNDVYLTLNGETRFRYDSISFRNLGVATGAVPLKTIGGTPNFTPAVGVGSNELYKQRYALGGDLHLGPHLRLYTDLYHGQQAGHNVGPTVPGNQRDDLGLVNGFAEIYGIVDDSKTGLRAGRQQTYLGNNLQVRANVSPNLPSPVFDGFRAYRDWGYARIDGFFFNLVRFNDSVLQDYDIAHINLWGVYTSYDLPNFALAGTQMRATLEPFYLGFRAIPSAGGRGGGLYNDRALLTGGKVVAATGDGFIAGQDHRHTFGLRAYGSVGGNVDYDWEAAYQAGEYAGLKAQAFAVNTSTGYTFHELPWRPRLGLHIDAASGGADRTGGTLHTYQPMYPNTQYYAPNSEFAPTNFFDVAPRITVTPLPTLRAEYYFSFLWRYAQDDAIYVGAPWPGAQGQNSYAVTALVPGQAIGKQSDLRITWDITPHIFTLFDFGVFWPASALLAAGGRTTTYLDANLTLKF